MDEKEYISNSPQETFDFGEKIGASLRGGEMILLEGGLGAGKTLLTKGILYALDYDVDEVTSPSFALVNLYRAEKFDVYHIDLWRLDNVADVAAAVGLSDILEDETAVVIIEWSERLKNFALPKKNLKVSIEGEDVRQLRITNYELRLPGN